MGVEKKQQITHLRPLQRSTVVLRAFADVTTALKGMGGNHGDHHDDNVTIHDKSKWCPIM